MHVKRMRTAGPRFGRCCPPGPYGPCRETIQSPQRRGSPRAIVPFPADSAARAPCSRECSCRCRSQRTCHPLDAAWQASRAGPTPATRCKPKRHDFYRQHSVFSQGGHEFLRPDHNHDASRRRRDDLLPNQGPTQPLMRSKLGSTSSAPSTATSITSMSSSETNGISLRRKVRRCFRGWNATDAEARSNAIAQPTRKSCCRSPRT